jgi:hypothetical protein
MREESNPLKLRGSIIKNRDGEELEEFSLPYDFSQGYIGNFNLITSLSVDDDMRISKEL